MDVVNNGNCANASNPYHQCTQACFQKTTKGTKHHHAASNGKKTTAAASNGRRSSTVATTTTTVVAGCPKASNPYHKCDANCNKTSSSNSGATPQSKIDHRKKRPGSKPEPPVLNSVPTTKVGGATNNISNASSTKPNYSENKKIEQNNDEIIPSSGPISGQLHIPDVMPKDKIKDGVAEVLPKQKETNKEDRIASSNEIVPATTNSDETGSKDFSFSGTPLPGHNKDVDTSSEGEADSVSVISESRISIGKYNVKESFGYILQTILDKYGDIGASCDLESVVMRSYYMECVCFVVQELQSSSDSISKSKVNELLGIVKDVESAHLRVAWLRNALDEIVENIELISQQQDMENEKANYDREMESLREQLELDLETLAQKEQEVADINARIPEIRDRLSKLEQLVSSALVDDQTTLPIKSKIDQLL
ncbi:phospholipase protein (PEARLI 4) family protein [Trifolium repens]|nr:phospholipase protein (PEARLI 4) family protein [Trifolium repens]